MVRPIKYTDPKHENLRKRVRLFRIKHAAEISAEVEHKRLSNLKQNGGNQLPTVFLYELVDEFGQAFDVIISSESEPPARSRRSPLLPSISINPKLARMVRDARLSQLAEWRVDGVEVPDPSSGGSS
jgi:hypothetical protein